MVYIYYKIVLSLVIRSNIYERDKRLFSTLVLGCVMGCVRNARIGYFTNLLNEQQPKQRWSLPFNI